MVCTGSNLLSSPIWQTDGPHWRKRDHWNSSRPLGGWHGVKVDGAGRVIRLDLRGNGLEGRLPEALCLLTHLQSLDLTRNHLQGEVPRSLGRLTQLTDLWLDENDFGPELRKSQLQSLLPNCRIRL